MRDAQGVAFDTSVLIAFFADERPWAGAAEEMLTAVARRPALAVFPAVVITELLTVDARVERDERLRRFEELRSELPRHVIAPVDYAAARTAARFRAELGVKTPDALILASAEQQGADTFITNDRLLAKKASSVVKCVLLDDLLP
ncbi:MAG: type II toxin-antitoxin system VapC family toxin [Armatimonadota bacterium]